MNKVLTSIAVAAVVAISGTALAQQKAAEPAKTAIPSGVFVKSQKDGQTLARTRLIGAKVLNKDGAVIGDIEDLILSSNNQVVGVIMGVGGFLGAGEKKVGVQYSALKFETKDGKTTVSLPQASKEVLAALDPYQRAEPQKSLLERAKDKAKELTDKTKETVKDASKKAGEAASGAAQKAKEAAQPAQPKAQ